MRILICNDDGIQARGLWALKEALEPQAEICIVAPHTEQSASSHSLTLNRPLRVHEHGERIYSVDGTPTDCVLMAVRGMGGLLDFTPDLIVSGINHGANLGDDVTYSGTVAAAFEGYLLRIPAIAFSYASSSIEFDDCARAAADLVFQLEGQNAIEPGMLLNVNFPEKPYEEMKGFRPTRLGKRVYSDVIVERKDPRGRPYYWIAGEPSWDDEEASDMAALTAGYVSVTPLHLDLTDESRIDAMNRWSLRLPRE